MLNACPYPRTCRSDGCYGSQNKIFHELEKISYDNFQQISTTVFSCGRKSKNFSGVKILIGDLFLLLYHDLYLCHSARMIFCINKYLANRHRLPLSQPSSKKYKQVY